MSAPGGLPEASAEGAGRKESTDPYAALLAHAEHELELAGRGELARLTQLAERWEGLVAACPETPPRGAADLLTRATLIHERTRVELLRMRAELLAELGAVRTARAAARGYGLQAGPTLRLERSA